MLSMELWLLFQMHGNKKMMEQQKMMDFSLDVLTLALKAKNLQNGQ